MFGQNLHPYQDLVFSDLYRITSVTVSLVVTLTLVSHAPPAELFRGDALCGERLICRWKVARQRHASPFC